VELLNPGAAVNDALSRTLSTWLQHFSIRNTSYVNYIAYLCSRDQAWFDRPTSCQVQLVGNVYCFKFLYVLFYIICRCNINTDQHFESKTRATMHSILTFTTTTSHSSDKIVLLSQCPVD